MVRYTQFNNNYLLQFFNDRIDVITIKELFLKQGFNDINTKSRLEPNYMCLYLYTNAPNYYELIVLPSVMSHGIVRFSVYCPTDTLLLSNTPICSVYPITSGYDKIKHFRMDL